MAEILSTNSVFWLSSSTMAFAFLSCALAYTIRSKCSSVKCCGCIEIIRDIDAEVGLEEQLPPLQPLGQSVNITPPEYNETRSSTRRNSQRNSQLINEAIKQLNKTEVIDFSKSMNI